MGTAMLTADWFLLGRDLYFRKFEIYSMVWQQEITFENFIATSAPYGGPIALRRNDRKVVKVQGSGQSVIFIFSGYGKQISSFKWTKKPIIHMGWSNTENLICIQEDAAVTIHDLFGKFEHSFRFSSKLNDTKIIDAKIFTSPQNFTGIAVMTSNFKIFLMNNIQERKTRELSDLPRSNVPPTCWAVVSDGSSTEVLIARGLELYRLKQDEHHTSAVLQAEFEHSYTAILDICVSFNARHVAFFTDSGCLWMGSTNLNVKYHELDTNIVYRPSQMMWCGNEAVVLYWERDNTLLIVGKHGQKMLYTYDSLIHLVPEIDGVRIISNTQHELLQKVPDVVEKIFRINSTDPGSFLLEASKQFQKGSHKANEYISLVRNDLVRAVEQCIEAVGYEFDTKVQKMLIRAAQFGKCYISDPTYSSDKYVLMCRLLRVMNAVRDPKIGIPITITQLQYLTYKVLLNRLIRRNHYYLAIKIAKYLNMPDSEGNNHILVHWAKYKVSQSPLEEETVAREIAEKLGYTPGISYSEIASTAADHGRRKLAIKLLDYESNASEQVELLLKLGENTPALVKAIESGDTDLVYMVLLKLRENMALGDFKLAIRNYPVAQSLYIKYCKEHNTQALNEIYIQEDDFSAQAEAFILESLDEKKSHMKDSLLTSAMEAYKKGRKDLYASMCEESLKLLRYQRDLEEKLGQKNKYVGKSVHETCSILLRSNDKLAEKFRNDFKIPDKRYWWLKINSLVERGEWEELEKFSKVKKSPIGYAPFVDVCLSKNRRDDAAKYLAKVGDDVKVKYHIKAGFYEAAADIAFQQRDIQSLLYVKSKTPAQSSLTEKINTMLVQLDPKRNYKL